MNPVTAIAIGLYVVLVLGIVGMSTAKDVRLHEAAPVLGAPR